MTKRTALFLGCWGLVMGLSLWVALGEPMNFRAEGLPVAMLSRSSGTVQYRPEAISAWDYTTAGQGLYAQDVVATGSRSTATLALASGQIIQLEENTQLELDFATDASDSVVKILKGRVHLAPDPRGTGDKTRKVRVVVGGQIVMPESGATELHLSRDVVTGEVSIVAEKGEARIATADDSKGSADATTLDVKHPMTWRVESPAIEAIAVTPAPSPAPQIAAAPSVDPGTTLEPSPTASPEVDLPSRIVPDPLLVRLSSTSARLSEDANPRLRLLIAGNAPSDVAIVVSGQTLGRATTEYHASVREGFPVSKNELLPGVSLTEASLGARLGPWGGPSFRYQSLATPNGGSSGQSSVRFNSRQSRLGWLFSWSHDPSGLALEGGPVAVNEAVFSASPSRNAAGEETEKKFRTANAQALGAAFSASWEQGWGTTTLSGSALRSGGKRLAVRSRSSDFDFSYMTPPWTRKNLRFGVLAFVRYLDAKYERVESEGSDQLKKVEVTQSFGGLGVALRW